jgi:hypothetical protein
MMPSKPEPKNLPKGAEVKRGFHPFFEVVLGHRVLFNGTAHEVVAWGEAGCPSDARAWDEYVTKNRLNFRI